LHSKEKVLFSSLHIYTIFSKTIFTRFGHVCTKERYKARWGIFSFLMKAKAAEKV